MKKFSFNISTKSATSRARVGTIKTPHGAIQTPAFVTVGTKATVKALAPEDLKRTHTQFIFSNTYHLVISPGLDIIDELGGIHAMSGINKPFITDSGGFQVFSLAFPDRKNLYDLEIKQDFGKNRKPSLVKISEDGVRFKSHIDGTEFFFTPEFSIKAQQRIGADFMVAFDECIYNGASEKYTARATERTHEWAERSITQHKKGYKNREQELYGVIQGGAFKNLRKKSTEFISSLPFFGIGLGGVSVGEENEELREQVMWIMDILHKDVRPRHLLGISTFEDVIFAVKQGVDTFDCVLPTRDARTGRLYIWHEDRPLGESIEVVNVTKSAYKSNLEIVNPDVLPNVSFAYLHHLFKQRELLSYRLATMNNLYVMEQFFARIREEIKKGLL